MRARPLRRTSRAGTGLGTAPGGPRPEVSDEDVRAGQWSAVAPFSVDGGENPYSIQHDLQQRMNDLVGIIRSEAELRQALKEIEELKLRARSMSVDGHRQYNPGWHLAIDLRNMLLVSEAIAKAALERQESRGGHTRDDFPGPDPEWGAKNLVVSLAEDGESVMLNPQPLPPMPDDLKKFFEGA